MRGSRSSLLGCLIPSSGKQHFLLFLFATLLVLFTYSDAKFCTSLTSVKLKPGQLRMCKESYQANCGWFTFKKCTFFEDVPCKVQNNTRVVYKIITDCCKGYKLDSNNLTCIRNVTEAVTDYTVTMVTDIVTEGDPDVKNLQGDDDDDSDGGISISNGAFAGIATAGLFMICVTIVIIIHVRKKYSIPNVSREEIRNSITVVSDPLVNCHQSENGDTPSTQLREQKAKKEAANPCELQKMVQA